MVASKMKKTVTVLETDSATTTSFQSFLGAVTVSSFIVIWLSSAASPLILFISFRGEHYKIAAVILLITTIAYLPWKRGPISRCVQSFIDRNHPKYYDGVSIVFEGGEVPPSEHRQTFFAVHPHGAFCIGWALLFTCPTMHGVRFCFAPTLFASPFFRLFSRAVGKPGSAARPSMNAYLKNGEDCALPPGGFEEATLTSTSQDRVFIKKRYVCQALLKVRCCH